MRKVIDRLYLLFIYAIPVLMIGCDFKTLSGDEIASTILESIKVDQKEIIIKDSSSPVSFSIEADCKWTIVDVPEWITITPMSGSGSRTVTLRVNSTSDIERSATIHVKGELFSREVYIKQEAQLLFDVSPKKPVQISKDGGEFYINVYSNTTWKIQNQSAWCHIPITGGNGNSNVAITCDNNQSNADRYDTIMVSITDSTIYIPVYQSKGNYFIYVAEKTQEFDSEGGNKTLSVQSNTSWRYRKKNQISGFVDVRRSGDDLVLSAGKNPYAYDRKDTIICEGVDFHDVSDTIYVMQRAQPPYLTINKYESPEDIHIDNLGGTYSFSVESNAEWQINVTCDDQGSWCKLSSPSNGFGKESGNVSLSIEANSILSGQRSATIVISTISGSPSIMRTFKLYQAKGPDGILKLADGVGELNFKGGGESLTFTIESNIGWKISNVPSWCTVSPTESSQTKTITVVAERNGGSDKRSETLTISPNPYTSQVNPITISLSQDPLEVPGGGDNPNPHYSRKR